MPQSAAVISAAHTKVHWGITKTANKIADKFIWGKMQEDIKKFILHDMCAWKVRGELKGVVAHAKGLPCTAVLNTWVKGAGGIPKTSISVLDGLRITK